MFIYSSQLIFLSNADYGISSYSNLLLYEQIPIFLAPKRSSMKTLEQWMNEYAVSHQNETNKKLHLIFVPLIFFSIIGIVMSIPHHWLTDRLPFLHPMLSTWATPIIILVLIFYARLSIALALKIMVFIALCLIVNYWIGTKTNLFYSSIIIFAVAWVGQFYGHKIEGKKPSFLHDIQFLLIGPAWILHEFFGGKRISANH